MNNFKYPFDIVAATASRLVNGDNYREAANRALRLLGACEECLLEDLHAREEEEKERQADELRSLKGGELMMYLAGDKNPWRAKEMLEARLKSLYPNASQEVIDCMLAPVKTGMALKVAKLTKLEKKVKEVIPSPGRNAPLTDPAERD